MLLLLCVGVLLELLFRTTHRLTVTGRPQNVAAERFQVVAIEEIALCLLWSRRRNGCVRRRCLGRCRTSTLITWGLLTSKGLSCLCRCQKQEDGVADSHHGHGGAIGSRFCGSTRVVSTLSQPQNRISYALHCQSCSSSGSRQSLPPLKIWTNTCLLRLRFSVQRKETETDALAQNGESAVVCGYCSVSHFSRILNIMPSGAERLQS